MKLGGCVRRDEIDRLSANGAEISWKCTVLCEKMEVTGDKPLPLLTKRSFG